MIQMVPRQRWGSRSVCCLPERLCCGKDRNTRNGNGSIWSEFPFRIVCYAPANDPEIAVAIVIEHGARGSNALPIAGKIFETYFYGQTLDEDSLPRNKGFYWENLVFHNTAPMQ